MIITYEYVDTVLLTVVVKCTYYIAWLALSLNIYWPTFLPISKHIAHMWNLNMYNPYEQKNSIILLLFSRY